MVTPGPSVFLFAGSERYLKESALDKFKASLASPGEEIDLKIFYGEEATASQIIDHAQGFPLFLKTTGPALQSISRTPQDPHSSYLIPTRIRRRKNSLKFPDI
jgi:hypothetical protein